MHVRRQFADLAVDEEGWFFAAEDLFSTAEILEPAIEKYWTHKRKRDQAGSPMPILLMFYEPDPCGIYLMLMAYAIENLRKGYLVVRNRRSVWEAAERGKTLTAELGGHKLEDLLSKIDFLLNSADKELAYRLWRSSVWAGRYPIPVRFDHETVTYRPAPGVEVELSVHREDDVQVVKNFFARIESFTKSRIEPEM